MKALVCHGPKKITCESVPDPVLADQYGAVVKTTLCGICGSDLHPYHIDMGRPSFCIGHEAVGEIVELGREVKGFSIGERVLVTAGVSCGRCRPCRAGMIVLCENSQSLRAYGRGSPGIGGGQAEGVGVPMADYNMFHLPQGISDEIGLMLTDTLSTAWYAARRARVGPGDVVAVIGLGAVGLQAVLCALAMGASRVLAIDLLPDRVERAVRLGAEAVDAADVRESLSELTKGRGADVVIDANGGPVTTALSVDLIAKGGRVSLVGISEVPNVPFPIGAGLLKNIEFHAGICSVHIEIPVLIRQLEAGRLSSADLEALFTHRMGLSEGTQAYDFFDQRKDGVLKIALDPTR